MSSALKKSFDYSVVDKDTKSDLIYFAGEILKARDAAAKSVIAMGKTLASAQERLANHSGGVFIQWVETECGFSERTAYNLIYAFREFGSFANFAKLEDSAMYALASPATPKKARLEAMKMADKGTPVTHAIAKEIIAKYKAQQQRSDNGKPGGGGNSSSNTTPVADGPAASQPAAVSPESDPFDVDPFEEESARGSQPEEGGENRSQTEVASPADSKADPEKQFREQRSKTVKTVEALMRAFDDLQRLRKHKAHAGAIAACKNLLQTAKNWQ